MERLISKLKESILLQIFTIALRYLLGSSFVYASILKIQGIRFTTESGENAPIYTLPHFFEAMYQSGLYWQFIGWGQFIAGVLLMTQLFSTLGAVVFFPIMLNIFILTISFESTGILILTLLMLLANIYLLLWDWNKLKFIVLPQLHTYFDDTPKFSNQIIWTYLGLVFFLIILFIRILNT